MADSNWHSWRERRSLHSDIVERYYYLPDGTPLETIITALRLAAEGLSDPVFFAEYAGGSTIDDEYYIGVSGRPS